MLERLQTAKTTVRVISDVDDVVETARAFKRTLEVADEIRKSTGVYAVLYENVKKYVGKGGFSRAITSTQNHMTTDSKVKGII